MDLKENFKIQAQVSKVELINITRKNLVEILGRLSLDIFKLDPILYDEARNCSFCFNDGLPYEDKIVIFVDID